MEKNDESKQIEIDNKNSNIMFFMALLTLFGVYIVLVIMNLLDNRIEPFGLAFLSFAYTILATLPTVLLLYKYETKYYNHESKKWIFIETIAVSFLIYYLLATMASLGSKLFYTFMSFLVIFLIIQTIKYIVYQKYCKTILLKGDSNGK